MTVPRLLLSFATLAAGCMPKFESADDTGGAWVHDFEDDEDDDGDRGGGSGSGGGSGDGGDTALCDGGGGIFHTVGDTVEDLGSTISGTISGGSLTFCAGHDYDVDVRLEGTITLASSDASSHDTWLWGEGVETREGAHVTMTGLTLAGMSERAILVYDNSTVELEDVVLTGGTAGVYVDHNGGELVADELRIVDNTLGAQLALLECSGTCTLTGSEISRNDDDNRADSIIKMGPQAHLRLIDTEIEDNTPILHVIDVRGGRLDMDGGSLAWNESDHTTIDASCSASSGGQRGRVQATASIGGNVSEEFGRLLYCGCDGDTAWVHNYSSPSTRTLSCD